MTAAAHSLEQVLVRLRRRQAEARRRFGLEIVGVVGSVARGEAQPGSDVDVVLRTLRTVTLFDLVRLQEALAAELERPVDLVFSEDMPPARRAYIERDLARL